MANEAVNALDAEIAVAGSILIDPESYYRVAGMLSPGCFQAETTRGIFTSASSLAAEGKVIDPISIKERALRQGVNLDDDTLIRYMELTPTAANDVLYAELVQKHAALRSLKSIASGVLANGSGDPDELIADTYGKISKLTERFTGDRYISSAEAAASFYSALQLREKGEKNAVSTGYPKLDEVLGGGFLKSGLYIIAARPGMGKTTFAVNLADRIEGKVLYVSLEMDCQQLTARRIACASGLSSSRLLMGRDFTEDEWKRVAKASSLVAQKDVILSRSMGARVSEIGLIARGIKGLSAVIIDYLGLITPSRRSTRYEEVTEISGELKRLAMKLSVPVIALSQLSRLNETRSDKRPHLHDLRDSGALEQDADGVLLLYRSDYYESGGAREAWTPSVVECEIAKNRHAGVGKVKFNAYLDTCRMAEA